MATRWLLWLLLVVHDPLHAVYIQVTSDSLYFDLTCNSNASLSNCSTQQGGQNSAITAAIRGSTKFPDLPQGQCGVTIASLTNTTSGEFRCTSEANETALKLVIERSNTTSAMTAVIGTSFTIPCGVATDGPINYCYFQVPDLGWLDLSLGEFYTTTSTHEFFGRGLREGSCALRLHDINMSHAGRISCWKQVGSVVFLHRLQLRVREPPLGGGVIAGIAIAAMLLIFLAVVIWLWRINRLPCQVALANIPHRVRSYVVHKRRVGKESGIYDEIDMRMFRPKTPPPPEPRHLQLMADARDGYITPVTIRRPEFDSKGATDKPEEVCELPCDRYGVTPRMNQPLVPRGAIVGVDRAASYMDMRINRAKEEPKYLSLIDITKEGETTDVEVEPIQDPMYLNMTAGMSVKPNILSTDDPTYLKMAACANPSKAPVNDPMYLQMTSGTSAQPGMVQWRRKWGGRGGTCPPWDGTGGARIYICPP